MEITELYYPQATARAGSYFFHQGIEIEVYSSRSSYFDWAKIRFTEEYKEEISISKNEPASIQLGYDGVLDDVFTGYVAAPYNGGAWANEITLKDEMVILENTIINETFQDTIPQEIIDFILAKAGFSRKKLSEKGYPARKVLSIKRQNAIQAIEAVHAAWHIKVPFFFSGGIFYWDERPEQKNIYTFEYGVNILGLNRTGGIWELETVSAPFVKHSHRIRVIHPKISGEVLVSKVVFLINDSGFIRTYIYF